MLRHPFHTVTATLLVLLLALPCRPALAHGVLLWAERVGDRVHVAAYTTEGHLVRDGAIRVLDAEGALILEGRTDGKGEFEFDAPPSTRKVTIRLIIDASHGARFELDLTPAQGSATIEAESAAGP